MSSAAAAAILVANGLDAGVRSSPAATATASRCRATFWARPPWACAIFFASPATTSAKATIPTPSRCSISIRSRCCASPRACATAATFASGRKLDVAPNLFLGATANPFVPPFRDRIANLEKKIDAGAQFIQTQFCFDVPMLADFMGEVRARELHKRCAIIVGVGTLSSAKSLRRMAQHVPGVHIPESVLRRIAGADESKGRGQGGSASRRCGRSARSKASPAFI